VDDWVPIETVFWDIAGVLRLASSNAASSDGSNGKGEWNAFADITSLLRKEKGARSWTRSCGGRSIGMNRVMLLDSRSDVRETKLIYLSPYLVIIRVKQMGIASHLGKVYRDYQLAFIGGIAE
jgi:hypothetical protein